MQSSIESELKQPQSNKNNPINQKAFKILSLDGGGIRGLYTASFLAVFEERSKRRIVDCFDMICGTSTGGIIALALSIGIPASKIQEFYVESASTIFPNTNVGFFKQLFGGKYSNSALRIVLEGVFGDKTIGDSESLLCIPSHSITYARPYIFKYDHIEGNLGLNNKISMVDVALATSAAPTYLPVVEIAGLPHRLVDGGVAANNPALVAYLEASNYFVGKNKEFDSTHILSIEPLAQPQARQISSKNKGVAQWQGDLIKLFSEGQARMVDFTMKSLSKQSEHQLDYLRVESPQDINPEDSKLISLDNTDKKALDLLIRFGSDNGSLYAVKPKFFNFFTNAKTYQLKERY